MANEWREVKFGEVAKLIRDPVPPAKAKGAPYIGLEHIGEGSLMLIDVGSANEVTSLKSRFREGDILFGKLRPYFRFSTVQNDVRWSVIGYP